MSREKFLPLSETDHIAEQTDGALQLALHLPVGVDTERIGVNAQRLVRLTRLAGAEALNVKTETIEDRAMVSNANLHGDGSATVAGITTAPKPQKATGEYDDSDHPMKNILNNDSGVSRDEDIFELHFDQMYKASAMTLNLNKTAIQDKLAQSDKYHRGIVDERGWAEGLNASTKAGFTLAAQHRYLPSRQEWFYGLSDLGTKYVVYDIMTEPNYALSGIFLGANTVHRLAQYYRIYSGQEAASRFNWSVFTHFRYDRALATTALANTSRLFKVEK